MAKKEPGQTDPTPEPDPNDPTPGTEPVPEPEPAPEPEPELPKEHKDKTPAQLVQELESLQKKLGTQGKELGDTKSNLAYQQQLLEMERQRVKEAAPTKVDEPKPVDIDYTNPTPGITEIVQRELQKDRVKQQKDSADYRQNLANANYLEGKTAMAENPKLYDGIESVVEQAVAQAYQQGYITAEDLNKKKTWDNAAKLVWLDKNDFTRLQEATVKPVTSTETELPTPAKPGTTEASFTGLDFTDPEVQRMMKPSIKGGDGLTKEEAEEIVKAEQEAIAKGER